MRRNMHACKLVETGEDRSCDSGTWQKRPGKTQCRQRLSRCSLLFFLRLFDSGTQLLHECDHVQPAVDARCNGFLGRRCTRVDLLLYTQLAVKLGLDIYEI